MKTKIVGILVLMLLFATMAIPISALNKENIPNNKPISKGTDVPVWEVGDSWTYEMELYLAASANVTDDMVVEVNGELTYEVVEDTGDTYQLTGTMRPMMGTVDLPGNIDMRITRLSSYSSNLEIQKADLSILNYDFLMKGIVLLTLGPIPLPIPLQMQHSRQTEFNPAFNVIPFPLNDGDTGTLGDTMITEHSETSLFWGIIPIAEDYPEWHLAECEYACTLESITVPAGTFDVYTVEADYNWGEEGIDWFYTYYAEDVGNVVKSSINIDFAETELSYHNMEMELVSTTYTP